MRPIASLSPLVALESTVISHGLPYPHNLRLALRLEEIVREGGATPATVGIIAGECGRTLFRLTRISLPRTYPTRP